jgi:hypothetical protein
MVIEGLIGFVKKSINAKKWCQFLPGKFISLAKLMAVQIELLEIANLD